MEFCGHWTGRSVTLGLATAGAQRTGGVRLREWGAGSPQKLPPTWLPPPLHSPAPSARPQASLTSWWGWSWGSGAPSPGSGGCGPDCVQVGYPGSGLGHLERRARRLFALSGEEGRQRQRGAEFSAGGAAILHNHNTSILLTTFHSNTLLPTIQPS